MEAQGRGMRPQTEGHLEPPEAGRGEKESFPRAFGGSPTLPMPLFQTFGLQMLKEDISAVSSIQLVVICHGRHRNLSQSLIFINPFYREGN